MSRALHLRFYVKEDDRYLFLLNARTLRGARIEARERAQIPPRPGKWSLYVSRGSVPCNVFDLSHLIPLRSFARRYAQSKRSLRERRAKWRAGLTDAEFADFRAKTNAAIRARRAARKHHDVLAETAVLIEGKG